MGQKNGIHAFGYNSAESEPIWMQFGTLRSKCWGQTLEKFWGDPHNSHDLREKFWFFCPVNNARFHRFPVGKFYDI